MIEIKIETTNSAFSEDKGCEVARILRKLADTLESGYPENFPPFPLFDINGNRVGAVKETTE